MPEDPSRADPLAQFVTTHWSMVVAASGPFSREQAEALGTLCRVYWYPLYAYVRRAGHGPEDAQDLTQDFFARLLRKEYISLANPERGKFRTFLLTSLKHFLVNEWQKSRTEKRGRGQPVLSLNHDNTETRFLAE